jgi:hypothetical protein
MERGRARRIERLSADLAALDDRRLADLEDALDILEHLETQEEPR